jgi:uncharacterized protein (DUF1015 family)
MAAGSALPRRPAGDGLRMRAFRAVRYTETAHPDLAAVISPPYDVIDEEERVELEMLDAHNVVRLILPRDGAVAGADRYEGAAILYAQWLDDDVLAVDPSPALYVYEQRRGDAVLQSGLFAAVGLEPLDSGVIFPHEAVRKGPVEDRLALMRAMDANPEPILLVHDGGGRASEIALAATTRSPLRTALTADGITHRLWAIIEPELIKEIQNDLSTYTAMIADGHHRYTTYGYLRDERSKSDFPCAAWDFGLALLIDLSLASPDVGAIHRVVPGLSIEDATSRARAGFTVVTEVSVDVPATTDGADRDMSAHTAAALIAALSRVDGHAFAITNGRSHVLVSQPDAARLSAAKPADRSPAWWALDASVAAAFLLEELWQVRDAEGVMEAEHDPAAAIRIAAEVAGVALLLKAPPLDGIIAVAVAGDTMPRKSTLFGPKPRSGVVLRSLADDF